MKAQGDVYPFLRCGDYVVIINAAQVRLTGHQGKIKGFTSSTAATRAACARRRAVDVRKRRPTRLMEEAVRHAAKNENG